MSGSVYTAYFGDRFTHNFTGNSRPVIEFICKVWFIWSVIFQSCVFHPLWLGPSFSGPAFSAPPVIWLGLGYQSEELNWKPFGGDPVLDTDSGSLFQFPHRCRMENSRRFISISDTIIGRFFTILGEMTDADKIIWIQQHLGAIRQTLRSEWMRMNPEIRIRISDHFWLIFWPWWMFALSEHRLVWYRFISHHEITTVCLVVCTAMLRRRTNWII